MQLLLPSLRMVCGALSITVGVVILSKSSVDKKVVRISSRTNIIALLLEKVCFCVQV
ncbi:unnamed protein product [Brassica rapa subsp. trilocularis]